MNRKKRTDPRPELRRHEERGFSLLELLVVVVIIGILMAIVVSSLLSARDKARQGATIADMRNISTAIAAYTVDHSRPPSTGSFIDVALELSPYLNERVPVRDHWGHAYDYASDVERNYSLTSFGKDGVDGPDLTPEDRFDFQRDIVMTNGEFPGLP